MIRNKITTRKQVNMQKQQSHQKKQNKKPKIKFSSLDKKLLKTNKTLVYNLHHLK